MNRLHNNLIRQEVSYIIICPNALNVDSLDLIMLRPYDFPTIVHAGNRYLSAKLYHYGSFIIANYNPAK